MKSHPLGGYLLVALAACVWGLWSLFLRPAEALAAVDPALEGFVVLAVVFTLTTPVALARRVPKKRPASAWWGLLGIGVADAFNILFFFWAMQRTSLAVAVLSHYLAPFLVAVAEPFVLGVRARLATFGYLAAALFGLVLLVEPWQNLAGEPLVGAGFGAASAVFYASNVLLTKRVLSHFSALEVSSYHAVPSLVVLALFLPHGAFAVGVEPLLWIGAGGVFLGTGAAFVFYVGLARIPASHASILALLEPVVAVLVGALVFHELLGPVGILGGIIVIVAAALVVTRGATKVEAAVLP